jgi:L-alanine-DL-glutamate epimerase-like enolase superfamily enzyme
MKITEVRVFELEGVSREGVALYEIHRGGLEPYEGSPYRQTFTEIVTDDGISGFCPGGSSAIKAFGQNLIGEDPACYEAIWEKLTTRPHSSTRNLSALSVLDLALWDLLGKIRGESVCRLLGGAVREQVRAYAGMLGFDTDPDKATKRSAEYVEKGFTALKWYLPFNEEAGKEGLRYNVNMVGAVRDEVGPDVDIMVDCILSNSSRNSVLYAIELAKRLEEFELTWLEEPLNPDDFDAYEQLAQNISIPLAFGERLPTRRIFAQAIDRGFISVLQPELFVIGGMTELRKVAVLTSTHSVPMIPHANESCRHAIHLLFSLPTRFSPLGEWGVEINHNAQYFYRDFYEPVNGYFEIPKGPGFGYEIDPEKIVSRKEL